MSKTLQYNIPPKNSTIFFIFSGCDACEEWYHGDCINITEREARYIRQYYCERCRQEDPSLQTRFKARKRDRDSDRSNINVFY